MSEVPLAQTQSALPEALNDPLKANVAPMTATPVASAETGAPLTAPSTNMNFADDLKSLTLPEAPVEAAPLAAVEAPANDVQAAPFKEVKVKKGDYLEKIAKAHRTSVSEIMKVNHLTNTRLKIGQVLKVPAKGAGTSAAHTEGGAKYYTVKSGDSPWSIAQKNHMKVEELLRLNNMDQSQARRLKPGDQLRVN